MPKGKEKKRLRRQEPKRKAPLTVQDDRYGSLVVVMVKTLLAWVNAIVPLILNKLGVVQKKCGIRALNGSFSL